MHRILWIAKRDYLAVVRTRAFIIGLVVFPILFGGGSVGTALLRNRASGQSRRIVILDRTGAVAATVLDAARARNREELVDKTTGLQSGPLYQFDSVAPDDTRLDQQRLELCDQLRRGELYAFIEIGPDALHPRANPPPPLGFYTNNGGLDNTQRWLGEAINSGLRRVRLAALGVPESLVPEVLGASPLESMNLVTRNPQTGVIRQPHKRGPAEMVVPLVLVLVLMIIVMIGASPMLTTVAEDKLQRVFEMLLGIASPFDLMAGKVVAAVATSLTSSVFYIIGGLLLLQGMALFGLAPLALLPWFFVYVVAEVTMLCAVGIALGATCGSPQDAQQLVMLVLSPVFVPIFLLAPVMQQPNGPLATALSLFPLFTPMVMMLRQSLPGGVPAWQPWAGLAGVLIVVPVITWGASRIFRVAVLAQGQRPNAAQLLRWAVRG